MLRYCCLPLPLDNLPSERGAGEGGGEEETGVNPGAEFSLPPLCKLLSKPTRIGRGPQGPFGKLIRKVVTDALAIKKKKRGEKLSQNFKKNAAAAARQFYCCQILFFFFLVGMTRSRRGLGKYLTPQPFPQALDCQ